MVYFSNNDHIWHINVKHMHLTNYQLLRYNSNDIMDHPNHKHMNNRLRKIIDEGCLTMPTTLNRGIETNIKYNLCPVLLNITLCCTLDDE